MPRTFPAEFRQYGGCFAMTYSQEAVPFKFEEFKKLHFPMLNDALVFTQSATSLAPPQF